MAAKNKFWTIRVAGGCEASVHGPYDTEIEQDEGMGDFAHELDSNTDSVVKVIVSPDGGLEATALDMDEMDQVADRSDDEDEED